MLGGNRVADFDVKQVIHQWNVHHNRWPIFKEAHMRRAMPDTQAVEEGLEQGQKNQ